MPETTVRYRAHWRKLKGGRRTKVWRPWKTTPCSWRVHFLKLANAFDELANGGGLSSLAYNLFILDGNSKLPFVGWSTLPVITCPGMGSCGKHCYSFRSWKTAEPLMRQIQNTLVLRWRPDLVREGWLNLAPGLTIRLYVDGDFENTEQFGFWMGLCQERPDLTVYGYSKSWDVIAGWGHEQGWKAYPDNYTLNLSDGGRPQKATPEQMLALPITRGWFLGVQNSYHPEGVKGNMGFKRYEDPAYHDSVLRAAKERGFTDTRSCPGKCGDCHWCGDRSLRGVVIANGIH